MEAQVFQISKFINVKVVVLVLYSTMEKYFRQIEPLMHQITLFYNSIQYQPHPPHSHFTQLQCSGVLVNFNRLFWQEVLTEMDW